MIQIVDYCELLDAAGLGASYYLQIIHRDGGFQCIAHSGPSNRLRYAEKSPPGIRYAQARLAYDSAIAARSTHVVVEDAHEGPWRTAHPYNDHPSTIVTGAERDALIGAPVQADRFDDPEHAERVAALASDALSDGERQREVRRAELEAYANAVQAEVESYYRELTASLMDPASTTLPVFAHGTLFITIAKDGGLVTSRAATIAAHRGESVTRDAPIIDKNRWIELAREVGGTFTMRLMEFGGHLFRLNGPAARVASVVMHDAAAVFTREQREAVLRSAHEQRVDVLLVDRLDEKPGALLTPAELDLIVLFLSPLAAEKAS